MVNSNPLPLSHDLGFSLLGSMIDNRHTGPVVSGGSFLEAEVMLASGNPNRKNGGIVVSEFVR